MEINIKLLFLVVLKKLHFIAAVALLFAVIAFAYSNLFIVPLYSSSAMLSIQASENREDYKSVTSADYTVSVELVSTISELIKDQACLNIVGEITGLNKVYSPSQLKSMVSISSKGTENFTVNVSCPNPEHALILANAFADVISDASFVNGNIYSADEKDPNRGYIRKILKAGTVTLISAAKNVPLKPSSPNIKKNILTGAMIGFVLTAGFFIIKELLSSKVLTEEDISKLAPDIPSLGAVPMLTPRKKGSSRK